MRLPALSLLTLILALLAFVRPAIANDPWSTEPKLFFCHAFNASEGVVYVSDVHRVGPFEERKSYEDRYADWLRASGRLGEGRARCLMRATMREIESARRDLPVSGCFDCKGPAVYRDVKWPFGTDPVESVAMSSLEPPRGAISPGEEAELDRRENPETRGGTTVFGRLDLTDAVVKSQVDDPQREKRALESEKGGRWYVVNAEDRCPGWGAVAFASFATSRRYFIGNGPTEADAMAAALARANDYIGAREHWQSGVDETYFNDTVEVDNRSLDEKAIDAAKGWIRKNMTAPQGSPPNMCGGPGVRG